MGAFFLSGRLHGRNGAGRGQLKKPAVETGFVFASVRYVGQSRFKVVNAGSLMYAFRYAGNLHREKTWLIF
jgi:hypothetical protein